MGMPTVVPVPVSAAGQVDMQGLVQQLLAQGQSQQQAFNSAMASMQAAGVQPTPQVQQATAQAVQAQSAGAGGMFSGMGSMGGIAIVAAMALASFALARPVGRTPSRRRS
jgi:septal ring-binding cell division protein DamX